MKLESCFRTFLTDIRPTSAMSDDLKKGHRTLRDRLSADEALKALIVSMFLQGSYRRSTANRPKDVRRSDVDIIVVTRMHEQVFDPATAMDRFVPFLNRHYKGKWRMQGRSFGIELSYVSLDLVITSAPSEAEIGLLTSDAVTDDEALAEVDDWRLNEAWIAPEHRWVGDGLREKLAAAKAAPEWKTEPLRIPDRDAMTWSDTHPLEQLRWANEKNAKCNGHYLGVVKALKWWRTTQHPEPKHPKGFPLERLVGEHCPDGIESVAEGVLRTLEAVRDAHAATVAVGRKPVLSDYGVPTHDVLGRLSAKDFRAFHEQSCAGAELARVAYDASDRYDSAEAWRELFGEKFPRPPSGPTVKGKGGGFEPPSAPAAPKPERFA